MARTHVMVRQVQQDEFAAAARVLDPANRFYPNSVFTLPLTRLMVAERWVDGEARPILYQPIYPSLSLGSFVSVQGATDAEIADSQLAITRDGYAKCHEWGMAELLLSTSTPQTATFALRHGFTEAHPTYRMEVRK